MGVSINEITRGMALKVDNNIFLVTTYNHVKPGKGSAFVRVNLRNVKTQQMLEKTFKSSESLDEVHLEEKRLQCLYRTEDTVHFMDNETFEEVVITNELLGEDINFLQDNMQVVGLSFNDKILTVQLPNFIIATIAHTEPGFKGDSSRAGNKPATIDTGAQVQVPLFIEIGDKVKLDTRDGSYVERVKQ